MDKANTEGIQRHREALRAIVKVKTIKMHIEHTKWGSGIQVDELAKWSTGVEAQQQMADEEIKYSSETLVQSNYKISLQAKKWEEELVKRDEEKQLQFERAQLEHKLEYENMEKPKKCQGGQVAESPAPVKSAKLPKLVITKFSREVTDWPRFWSQFKAEINCSQVPAVTKFSYLKELVNPKVKTVIDGLPFTKNVNSSLKTS